MVPKSFYPQIYKPSELASYLCQLKIWPNNKHSNKYSMKRKTVQLPLKTLYVKSCKLVELCALDIYILFLLPLGENALP